MADSPSRKTSAFSYLHVDRTEKTQILEQFGEVVEATVVEATLVDEPPDLDGAEDARLAALLNRLGDAVKGSPASDPGPGILPVEREDPSRLRNDFVPREPESFEAASLTESDIESLLLKCLLSRGDMTGRELAAQICMPFILIDELLRALKNARLLVHQGSAPMNDYLYRLTDAGFERSRRLADHCTYFGAAPVSLADYVESVHRQSLTHQHPTAEDLTKAFGSLVLSEKMLDRLGPAINSGRGLFLFGPPGNGKTSIAERATAAFGLTIWVPRALLVDGEIIRVFDPINHLEEPIDENTELIDRRHLDRRWVRIRRPSIVAGGELTMSALEVTVNESSGICEAPLQLKSNCGTLVIDDFGRQRMSIDELLNRWIVPLEKRYDFLNLPNGKKVQVPFDQLIIFSTNLEPRDLVDEAFLRRIPYKIEVCDPTEEQFRDILRDMSASMGFEGYDDDLVDDVLKTYFRDAGRPLRFCHPRDLLLQIRNYCTFHGYPLELKAEYFELAVENYFSVM